ncbi:Eco57I restriction-modification methylase domain-containing protein, partial [Herpetosiphon sp. NSE202]|uniref:Eco57I restriction-modification methylase domain-containing protein n=1 Tax=Herpetosiphon sp. NSE202 TaxID=3351349 RepID=UPI00362777D1
MNQAFDSNDVQLTRGDIRQLQHADALAGFLARLQYSIDLRTPIDDYAQIGLSSPDLRHEIRHVELLATDPHDQEIKIYLLEVRSLTAALRNAIARAFRDRPELALFILTKDYETFEFVLLLRELAQTAQRGTPIRQIVRPVPLTIKRTSVTDAELRVLKRFTMSEPDALYQWDKLRSAFVLAEWSEEYFNNRALFSDYYLKQRLTDPKLNREWADDVLPIGRKINPLLKTARKQLTNQPLANIQKQFYTPILSELGFVAQPVADAPAYRYDLHLPKSSTPVAAFFGYVWNRNLDDQDTQRDSATPAIIPGAEVVSTLEAGTVPWVIVSNGKYWRLYSTTASNKATNYYEVDLEEAFGAQDALDALKYWWLFFRAAAFSGFLDRMLKQSAEYAKGLGERLKDRVFTEIFPQFAQGFIADMRRQGQNTLSESQLNTVFEGTLTLLYRLMFVLYAESLDLLPLNEQNGYREQSLYTIKQELAEAGGTLLDQRQTKLQARYSDTSTALYQRILALCAVIDRGSPDLNMPTYNGGLFSPSSLSGQFLQTYAVPDRYLALGLDRLARDLDDRSQALVLIDFKSLGVRQLGSIYEGLLEFKLHIASERLAVTKEKGKEVYQPAAKVAKPLAVLEQGMAYLVNDKKERKATGSYYTPDYIVKYIVQQTVGAVLDEKFKALAPRLHEAQKQYRDYAKLVAARAKTSNRPGTADVFWTDPNNLMLQLLDDCLNVRVLDPAMGSGHFLVEVVDFISNRLIHFLNAWSDNPVWAMIDRTRNEIVADMERQGVTIDRERLTRVALLKRAVLKRCIYGVDLNSMAVELAKVSLWLDAFTLGAPLSFLDHHLKHGNSLIGARVEEVQEYLDVGGSQSHMLAGNEFAGLSLATDLMRQVSFLSDNTVEQAQQSAVAFRDADQHLAPFKRMLDVYTSRWFGNQPAKKSKSDWVNIFLRMPSIKPWLHDASATLDDSLIPASQISRTALEAASNKHFFHWELEFPEIFFASSTPGGQDIQLNPNGGFDAVVGNPPWGAKIDTSIKNYLRILYGISSISEYTKKPILEGEINVYTLFMFLSLDICIYKGKMGLITPEGWTVNKSEQYFRKFLLDNVNIINISILRKNVFSAAPDIIPVISIIEKQNNFGNTLINVYGFSRPINLLSTLTWKDSKNIKQSEWYNEPYFVFTLCQSSGLLDLYKNIKTFSLKLGSISTISISDGIYKTLIIDDVVSNNERPILVSADDMKRYSVDNNNNFITFDRFNDIPIAERMKYDVDKLIFHSMKKPSVEYRVVCYWDHSTVKDTVFYRYVVTNNFVILTASELNISLGYISAVCNSKFINYWYSERYIQVNIEAFTLGEIPIARIKFTTDLVERERLTQMAIDLYTQKNDSNVLTFVNTLITAAKTNSDQFRPIPTNSDQFRPIPTNSDQ